MKRFVFILLGLSVVFLLSGVLSMVWSYQELQTWNLVVARVSAIDVTKFTRKDATRYRGEVTLRYTVNDIIHRVPYSLPVEHATEDLARAELSRFPPGTQMRLFVNPKNPDDTLQDLRATPRFYWFPGMLTAVGLILGGYCLFSLSKLGTCLCPGCAASVELWDKFCYACDYKLPKQKKLVRI